MFTGLLPLLDSDDALASVVSHEIAHNLAHHSAERLSQSYLAVVIINVFEFAMGIDHALSGTILDLAFSRPGSRKQEVDYYACHNLRTEQLIFLA